MTRGGGKDLPKIGNSRPRDVRVVAVVLTSAAVITLSVAMPTPSRSQDRPATAPEPTITDQQSTLRGMQDSIDASTERRTALQTEIESLRDDNAKLKTALIEATRRIGSDETKIADTQTRLAGLAKTEAATRRSLDGRRAIIIEVLAALQRMGRKPPPALLVDPDDVLKAIRTSMLLGAVLPSMKAETAALIADLTELSQVHRSIDAERQSLAGDLASIKAERERLAALIDARQASMGKAEAALGAERDKAQDLARQASSLKELIGRMEAESKPAGQAADAARKVDGERQNVAALSIDPSLKPGTSPFKDPARLTPAVAFPALKGLLPLPVSGLILRNYGTPDGFGGTEKGISFQTGAGSVVASPSDGWIAFAGAYRSFGQLVIINAGGGFYIVLAGMDRINVDLGQFVLAGEPIAVMGDGSTKTAAAVALGAAQPILYVEFRKDGASIDPGPWWAKPELQKVRG